MKKIILSLLTISLVTGGAIALSGAQFSDREQSLNNTFETGTIDIAVDGQNPWTRAVPYHLTDMKPSQTDYIDFVIHNVGTNPVNVSKVLSNFRTNDVVTTEPECLAENGSWPSPSGPCASNVPVVNVDSVINYDLRVELYSQEPTENSKPVWWETIYQDSDNATLALLSGKSMLLGMIPENWYMKVKQSYHMPTATDNKYQGDQLAFDITLNAEQLTNTLVLEDKYLSNTDVSHHVWLNGGGSNGKDATLTYKVKERTFDYSLVVQGMTTNGDYTLVAWEDPSYIWPWGTFTGTTVLANVTVAGGAANIPNGSVELNQDLINAKVWLVPGNKGLPGATGVSLNPWDETNTLFDTALMDYYDADL